MYKYYISFLSSCNTGFSVEGIVCNGVCYELDYKIDSSKNISRIRKVLENDGYKDPVILAFQQLNE